MNLDLSKFDLSGNVPFQLFTVLMSIFLIIDISLVYLGKILDRIFRFINSENIFRKSLLVCLTCSIPKAFLIFSNLQYGIEDNGAFTNGMGIFNITLGLPLLILKSPSACFINHSSFLKDLFFLEFAFLNHFFDISETNFQFPIFAPVFGLGVFFIFMFYTFKLPETLNIETLTESSAYLNSGLISKPFKSIFGI
ncbi:hypothetical protein NBO_830gi001 [Nosema bombycis CQ1]|uniref:Uncharacterized protein n=1 Tax=Nosema bombycis (strain CQ1 / CVCC 102059) TaxID=578461 RepID=R0M187_NOSB1|nr:hypothetical protein NBO_830gi001 [Nosema bombycis CQ1]|eukprot:EOB11789.1 hypothetical protein NBO_830gi001 [Nosema bombycis CQ1]